jgi:hypothetical protein
MEFERELQSERQATYDALKQHEPLLPDDRDRGLLATDRTGLRRAMDPSRGQLRR